MTIWTKTGLGTKLFLESNPIRLNTIFMGFAHVSTVVRVAYIRLDASDFGAHVAAEDHDIKKSAAKRVPSEAAWQSTPCRISGVGRTPKHARLSDRDSALQRRGPLVPILPARRLPIRSRVMCTGKEHVQSRSALGGTARGRPANRTPQPIANT